MWRGRYSTPFVTPEDNPPGDIPRRILVPGNEQFAQLVTGVLSELLKPENFTETPGGLSVEDTVQRFHEMFTSYLEPMEVPVSLPIGVIMPHAMAGTLPSGWLMCDGAQYDAADYPDLFAVLPSNLKQETTFNVPDLRERVPVGAETLLGGFNIPVGGHGGSQTAYLDAGDIPNHSHSINALLVSPGAGSFPARGNLASWVGGVGSVALHNNANPGNSVAVTLPDITIPLHSTNPTGGGELTGHNNLQPYTIVHFAIVALAG